MNHLFYPNNENIYKRIEEIAKKGYLPVMAGSSCCNIGALGAQSLCKRIISAVNILMTDKKSASERYGA